MRADRIIHLDTLNVRRTPARRAAFLGTNVADAGHDCLLHHRAVVASDTDEIDFIALHQLRIRKGERLDRSFAKKDRVVADDRIVLSRMEIEEFARNDDTVRESLLRARNRL